MSTNAAIITTMIILSALLTSKVASLPRRARRLPPRSLGPIRRCPLSTLPRAQAAGLPWQSQAIAGIRRRPCARCRAIGHFAGWCILRRWSFHHKYTINSASRNTSTTTAPSFSLSLPKSPIAPTKRANHPATPNPPRLAWSWPRSQLRASRCRAAACR